MLSTAPVARGDRYCSPACGRGCTKAEYDAAVAGGAALARQLGVGWRPQVWEHLGWHHRAISPDGRLKVHPSAVADTYVAYLGSKGQSGGRWSEHGKTPQGAVDEVRRVALIEVTEAAALLDMTLVGGDDRCRQVT